MNETPRVLLLSMPFGALDRPSLALGLLKAELHAAGVSCDVKYASHVFAEMIGPHEYRWVNDELPHTAFPGEWLFRSALFGPAPDVDEGYVSTILGERYHLREGDVRRLLQLRERVDEFCDVVLESTEWSDYEVVGFTSTFQQNLASLALARHVKTRFPGVLVAFGGANWEGEMGRELMVRFPFVDVAFSGEADRTFPAFVQGIGGSAEGSPVPPGVLYRGARGEVLGDTRHAGIEDLDALPTPDYDDYFDVLSGSDRLSGIDPELPLESSRGCWWGARHHCTFCGLNGLTMTYRAKSGRRVLDELDALVSRYEVASVAAVDNILDTKAFTTFLPELAMRDGTADLHLFYETKANLRHDQLRILRAAGVTRIQPGIESLSDHVLELMRKGTTGLQNIQLLKWCRELGIEADWNFIYGFPGETAADYEAMLPMLAAVDFLQPPTEIGPLRLDRFSPYHQSPSAFGMGNVRAMAPYRYLYPFEPDVLARIAYYFDYDSAEGSPSFPYTEGVVRRVHAWMRRGPGPALRQLDTSAGDITLTDRRSNGTGQRGDNLRLRGWQAHVYDACDRVTSTRRLAALAGRDDASVAELRAFLARCREHELLVSQGDHHLALAVRTPPRTALQPGRPGPRPD